MLPSTRVRELEPRLPRGKSRDFPLLIGVSLKGSSESVVLLPWCYAQPRDLRAKKVSLGVSRGTLGFFE